jgi:hypothetical protein
MTTHITKTWFDGEKVVTQEIPESEIYKQEPVAWMYDQWQGLTDDDVKEITKNVIAFKSDVVKFIREAEAKLKEKNGG